MNIPQRDARFLAFTAKLAHVKAVAEAIGCPEWTDCCDAVDHPRSPHECYCAKAAEDVLKVERA